MIVLGTHSHPAEGEAARRQRNGHESLRALLGVKLVDLQFEGPAAGEPGFDTRAVLRLDSRAVTGRSDGVRKPIASEAFSSLAAVAREVSAPYFGWTNSDVVFRQEAVDRVARGDKTAYVFCRAETDEQARPGEMMIHGADAFFVSTRWWSENEARFRPYIVGESTWDNVYASILLAHGDGVILNREPLILHERHERAWGTSPFADYIGYLASLDRRYFTLWAVYIHRLGELRGRGATEADELALAREVFVWRPTLRSRAVDLARAVKAWARYRLASARRGSSRRT